MSETGTWNPGKRPWRKPSMQRQRRCSNHCLIYVTETHSVLKGTGLLKRRRKTQVERISLPTPPLLTHLVGNSYYSLSRLSPSTQRRTKTTAETFGVEWDKTKTSLRQASTLTQRRTKETFLKLIVSTAGRRAIISTNVFKKRKRS